MSEIIQPTNCPSCDSTLVQVKDQLFCKNPSCTAQLEGKLVHFCKVLGIKGLGPKTIEKLELGSIVDIFYLDEHTLTEAVGTKVAIKLLDEIERAKGANLATVLESLSIPLVGGTASKKVASVAGNFEQIDETLCKTAGLGEKVTSNLLDWLENEYQELKEFLPFNFEVKQNPLAIKGKTVCITGKLSSYKKKADAEQILADNGYVLVDSVTKTLNYLVDEGDGTSAKRKKAEQYGILIITDLNDLLKENTNE